VPTTPARRSPRSAASTSTARRRPSRKLLAERAAGVCELLAASYPGSADELCALKHRNAFQLLCATILSAQCTDDRVNVVTPALFRKYSGPRQLAAADREELEEIIRSTGFFRSKASHLIGMAQGLLENFGPKASDFPTSMEDLISLPGVGRKTANVVRSVALGLPGLPVDTHVLRVSRLLGLTTNTDPVKVETDLCALVPEQAWGALSLRLILHGRVRSGGDMPIRPARRYRRTVARGVGRYFEDDKPEKPANRRDVASSVALTWATGTGSRHLVPSERSSGSAARPAPDGALRGAVGASGHRFLGRAS
jgi:endonuclease-3